MLMRSQVKPLSIQLTNSLLAQFWQTERHIVVRCTESREVREVAQLDARPAMISQKSCAYRMAEEQRSRII
jgi:hypothetical protein